MRYKVTSPFGQRVLNGVSQFHKGIDIVFLDNKNVASFSDGVVGVSTIITDRQNKTWEWGNYIRIDGKDGLKYYYCHLDSRKVKVGDKVKIGDFLGVMGNTGYSFGAHTHFEIRNGKGESINPTSILPKLSNVMGEYDYLFQEDKKNVENKQNESEDKAMDIYNTIADVPSWARPTIKKLMDKKLLLGDTKGNLSLTDDLVRMLVINDRAKLYD